MQKNQVEYNIIKPLVYGSNAQYKANMNVSSSNKTDIINTSHASRCSEKYVMNVKFSERNCLVYKPLITNNLPAKVWH